MKTEDRRRWLRNFRELSFSLLIALFIWLGPPLVPEAVAQDVFSGSTCAQANSPPDDWPFGSSGAPVSYYVHENFADKLKDCSPVYDSTDNVTQIHATGIVKHAAELWNLNALGTPFVYRGHTDADTLQDFCSDPSIRKPAVMVDFRVGCVLDQGFEDEDCMEECNNHGDPSSCSLVCNDPDACLNGVSGTVNRVGGCDDAVELILPGDQFEAHSCGASARRWHLDDVDSSLSGSTGKSGDRSLLRTLTHELGHVLNLGHTSNAGMGSQVSLMDSSMDTIFPNRHPTKWDKDCVLDSDSNNYRRLNAHHQSLPFGASSWNSVVEHPYSTDRGHAVDGHWWDYHSYSKTYYYSLFSPWSGTLYLDYYQPPSTSGDLEFTTGFKTISSSIFDNNYDATPSFFSVSDGASGSDDQRIAFQYHGASPSGAFHPPDARYLRSDDLFSTYVVSAFWRCTGTSSCSPVKLRSSVPMTHTYDLASGTDIFVTVQETDSHDGGSIHVHPGLENWTTLRKGFELSASNTSLPSVSDDFWDHTHLTDFKPAVACAPVRDDFNYNCLLAWTSRGSLTGRVLYTYFYYDSGADTIQWRGTAWARSGSHTRSHVSAAWFEDSFWMGWKHWTNPQSVRRTQNSSSGSYTSWSTPVRPGGVNQPTVVDPPTFFYWTVPPGLLAIPDESGWAWTEQE